MLALILLLVLPPDPPTAPAAAVQKSIQPIKMEDRPYSGHALFADEPFVLVGGKNNFEEPLLKRVDLRDGKETAVKIEGFGGPLAFSPDGSRFAGFNKERKVTVRAFPDAKEVALFEVPNPGTVRELRFLGNDRLLMQFGAAETLAIWNIANGTRVKRVVLPYEARRKFAVSPGGRYLAYPLEKAIEIDDLTERKEIRFAEFPKAQSYDWELVGLGFSVDGSELAALFTRSDQFRLQAWKLADAKVLYDAEVAKLKQFSFDSPAVQATADGKGWWLKGEAMVDRAIGKELWRLEKPKDDYRFGKALATDHVILELGSYANRRLESHRQK